MGDIAKKIRHGKILGPNQRGFKRSEWDSLKNSTSIDADDKRLLYAGLLFDDLLSFIRKEIHLSETDLSPSAIIRLVVGLATHNLFQIYADSGYSRSKNRDKTDLMISTVLAKTVQVAGGQSFSPDELLTGAGDGMKHILRELQGWDNSASRRNEYQTNITDVNNIFLELNKGSSRFNLNISC